MWKCCGDCQEISACYQTLSLVAIGLIKLAASILSAGRIFFSHCFWRSVLRRFCVRTSPAVHVVHLLLVGMIVHEHGHAFNQSPLFIQWAWGLPPSRNWLTLNFISISQWNHCFLAHGQKWMTSEKCLILRTRSMNSPIQFALSLLVLASEHRWETISWVRQSGRQFFLVYFWAVPFLL